LSSAPADAPHAAHTIAVKIAVFAHRVLFTMICFLCEILFQNRLNQC
jgi:hypothetical protein